MGSCLNRQESPQRAAQALERHLGYRLGWERGKRSNKTGVTEVHVVAPQAGPYQRAGCKPRGRASGDCCAVGARSMRPRGVWICFRLLSILSTTRRSSGMSISGNNSSYSQQVPITKVPQRGAKPRKRSVDFPLVHDHAITLGEASTGRV